MRARDAGYPDLPVPPTFLFGLKLDGETPLGWITDLGVDLRFVLHGTQRFDYERHGVRRRRARAAVRASPTSTRSAAVRSSSSSCRPPRSPAGTETVAVLSETIVVRHPEKEAAA